MGNKLFHFFQCSYLGRKPLDLRNEGPPVVQLPEVCLAIAHFAIYEVQYTRHVFL